MFTCEKCFNIVTGGNASYFKYIYLSVATYIYIYFICIYLYIYIYPLRTDRKTDRQTDRQTDKEAGGKHKWISVDASINGLHVCVTKCVICSDYPPLQPFPLQEAREVHGLLVGGKWSFTQIITNYSAGREGEEGLHGHLITR